MLALIAALVFLLALVGVTIGAVNLITLGLFLLALHFAFEGYIPFPWHRGPRA